MSVCETHQQINPIKRGDIMSDYRRLYVKGGTYFFTVVMQDRRPIFSDPHRVRMLDEIFESVMEKQPFTTEALVVLPDHLHCIWSLPEGDNDFSSRWKQIKYRFSLDYEGEFKKSISMSKKKEKGLWQRRFWEHLIRDQEDFNRHVDYIHYNPVKHGLVKRPADWVHGSFKRFFEKGIYPEDWGTSFPTSIKGLDLE